MSRAAIAAAAAGAFALATAAPAAGAAEGPATPQAVAANAEFLAEAPAPPSPGVVCVVDSGVDTNTDVAPAIVSRFADDGGSPDDLGARSDTGEPLAKHGTYVAGVIASQIDGAGSSGIWPRARIVSVRVFDGPDSATTAAAYIRGIQRCSNQPDVKVINLSLAGLEASVDELARLETAVVNARDVYGINVVAAAGNRALDSVAYPARFSTVLAVGATTAVGALAPFSNRGMDLDISAMGVDVCLSHPNVPRLAVASGTSFAAPIVSAVLAAMRAYDPTITVAQAEQYLLQGAGHAPAGAVLDAEAAFRLAGLGAPVNAYEPSATRNCASPPPSDGGGHSGAGGSSDDEHAAGQAEPEDAAVETPPLHPTEVPASQTTAADRPLGGAEPHARPKLDRPDRPRVQSVRYRRGVLRVRIGGYRKGMRAVFVVDGRRYVRRADALRLKIRRWRTIRVWVKRPGAPRSASATIRRDRDF